MKKPEPVTLYGHHARLEPMHAGHDADLAAVAADGELWKLRVTSVPEPDQAAMYIAAALMGQHDGHMLPFVVREPASGQIVGSTRYHDIVPAADRVEIGYTWYARRVQRTAINTPSYHQVVQPIYQHARYRWKRYERQIGQKMAIMAPLIRYFGYADG